jgi:hypothetical protein
MVQKKQEKLFENVQVQPLGIKKIEKYASEVQF